MNATWEALINNAQTSQTQTGPPLANSVTLTDVTPGANVAGQAFTIPASYLHVGQQYRVAASGIVSTTGTPTLSLGVYFGGVAGVAVATTGAVATISGLSSAAWVLDAMLRVEQEGPNGQVRAIGHISGIYPSATMLSAAAGAAVTVNTSAPQILTIGAQWGTASASNSLQVLMFTVERLNEGGS